MIESDKYREELEALKADPIIIDMAKGASWIPENEMDTWGFMYVASREYDRRHGVNARSIGGPARAIKALVTNERNNS